MKIDIWSDFTCPWCYIGKINLDKALKEENITGEYIYHSYQTVPTGYYPPGKSYSICEVAQKGGMTKENAIQKADSIEKMGKEAGILLNMNDVKMTDTTNAHRLLQLAHKYNSQDAFMMKCYHAVFTEGADIGVLNTLKQLAVYAGIPEQEVKTLFETNDYVQKVQDDVKNTKIKMITGVPYNLFNDSDTLCGAQLSKSFQSVINKNKKQDIPIGVCCSNGKCE